MLKPFADYILLEELPPAERSASGLIHIPQTAQVKYNQGSVVDYGPDAHGDFVKGEILVFPLHSEYRVEHRNRKFILIKASEVMAQITDDGDTSEKELKLKSHSHDNIKAN